MAIPFRYCHLTIKKTHERFKYSIEQINSTNHKEEPSLNLACGFPKAMTNYVVYVPNALGKSVLRKSNFTKRKEKSRIRRIFGSV